MAEDETKQMELKHAAVDQIHPVLLITGVAGYVGHHMLQFVQQTYPSFTVYATHHSKKPVIESHDDELKHINHIKMDLADAKSIQSAVETIFKNNVIPQIIIHCAAITSPSICHKQKEKAMTVNCCTVFVQTLLSNYKQLDIKQAPLFIFLSTDHVYDGEISKCNKIPHLCMHNETESKMETKYNEQSACYPCNYYGESKLKMEKYLLMHWDNLVILRPSVIFGPNNEIKTTLLQFVLNGLKDDKQKELILFKNERRSFVSIWSVLKTMQYFMNSYYRNRNKQYHDIYNCGGAIALSRVDFGAVSAKLYGFDMKKINAMNRYDCKQKWAHIAPNPQDISMSSAKLYTELKEHYSFPQFVDLMYQIKAHETNNKLDIS